MWSVEDGVRRAGSGEDGGGECGEGGVVGGGEVGVVVMVALLALL